MGFAGRCGWLLAGMWAAGCSSSVAEAPMAGLDSTMPNDGRATADNSNGGSTSATAAADACSVATNWQAYDVEVESTDAASDFADVVNMLLKSQTVPALSISNHMAPHCVWMVAFSAADTSSAGVEHAATYTEMSRHPAGIWTAAPQATGWIRLVDAASRTVWIPIANVTGSASFGATDCSSISRGDASAVIPTTAAALPIATPSGTTSLGALLGKTTSKDGWQIHLTFSAEAAP